MFPAIAGVLWRGSCVVRYLGCCARADSAFGYANRHPQLQVKWRQTARLVRAGPRLDRKSVVQGKSVTVRVALGCRRLSNNKSNTNNAKHVLFPHAIPHYLTTTSTTSTTNTNHTHH